MRALNEISNNCWKRMMIDIMFELGILNISLVRYGIDLQELMVNYI